MPTRIGKVRGKKLVIRQPSPEIPSPVKPIASNIIDDDIENKMPIDEIESKDELSSVKSNEIDQMTIILANGQPLLTNFEEKYLIDLILKSTNKDFEIILQEKINFILEMNYGIESKSFTLNPYWIYDFILKHFQTLSENINSKELFDKILKKNFDKNNSTINFKHWQLQTLIKEHTKTQPSSSSSSSTSQQRRMTVRRINFNNN